MRCKYCTYGGSVYEYGSVEEYAEVCGLVNENEITFNKFGCGCKLTGATIQKRYDEWKNKGVNNGK